MTSTNSLHVVPAKAGTHYHQPSFGEDQLPPCRPARSRGLGPGLRRDDKLDAHSPTTPLSSPDKSAKRVFNKAIGRSSTPQPPGLTAPPLEYWIPACRLRLSFGGPTPRAPAKPWRSRVAGMTVQFEEIPPTW